MFWYDLKQAAHAQKPSNVTELKLRKVGQSFSTVMWKTHCQLTLMIDAVLAVKATVIKFRWHPPTPHHHSPSYYLKTAFYIYFKASLKSLSHMSRIYRGLELLYLGGNINLNLKFLSNIKNCLMSWKKFKLMVPTQLQWELGPYCWP